MPPKNRIHYIRNRFRNRDSLHKRERAIDQLRYQYRSDPKTSVKLDFMNNSSAAEYDFITFVNKKELREMALTKPVDSIKPLIFKNEDEGAELRMNFLLDITPDASID